MSPLIDISDTMAVWPCDYKHEIQKIMAKDGMMVFSEVSFSSLVTKFHSESKCWTIYPVGMPIYLHGITKIKSECSGMF